VIGAAVTRPQFVLPGSWQDLRGMATKEALYMALDVSGSMCPHIADITGSLQAHLCDKVIHAKSDAFGLALVGTAETDNECARSMSGYDHISIMGEMGPVKANRIESVGSIQAEDGQADAIDALVVASDALVRYVRKLKWTKRIMLISDGETITASADDDCLSDIAAQLVENKIRLDVVTVGALSRAVAAAAEGRDVSAGGDLGLQAASDVWAPLSALRDRVHAIAREKGIHMPLVVVSQWEQLKAEWAEPYKKNVRPTASYRGPINISGKHLAVRVWKKVSASSSVPVKFKSISKRAAELLATAGDDPEAAADAETILTETRFHRATDPDTEVPPEMRVSAYRYGTDLIPLSGPAEEGMKYGVAEKCFELHGFVPQSAVPRHFFLGTTDVVVGDDAVAGAREAVQALCIAMDKAGKGAIARYAPRAKTAPRLVFLLPGIKCLYMNQLPFKDEVKSLLWPPLAVPPPTDAQRSAAVVLVEALDLDTSARRSLAGADADEARIRDMPPDARASLRRPKDTTNPTHQRYFKLLKHKMLHPEQPPPPPPWPLIRPLQPDTGLFTAAQPALTALCEACPVGPMLKHSAKRVWKEPAGESTNPAAIRQRGPDAGALTVQPLPSLQPSSADGGAPALMVDSGRPVETFWQVLGDKLADRVEEAIKQMEAVTLSLFARAARPDDAAAAKAFRCLRELRRACVQEDEPTPYNEFLDTIKKLWLPDTATAAGATPSREPFWSALAADTELSAGKISRAEAEDSTFSEEEARAFLHAAAPAAPSPAAAAAPFHYEADDFEDLE
jgi:ATP-dependent DNA helicase 2 subunit 2